MNKLLQILVAAIAILTACTLPSQPEPALAPATAPSTASTPTAAPMPTPTKRPTPTPSRPDSVLKITGPEEVVFDWTVDRCEEWNIPDLAARAFRGADGQVQLILSHFINYRMLGADLNSVKMDCEPIMGSQEDADPSLYADHEWIASPYTEDGSIIYSLIHNEYQGHKHPGQCPQQEYWPCWDNSITLGISTDGGRTYGHAAQPPEHLVARLPYPYEAGSGPEGARTPSNIIKGPEGFYYSFFNVSMVNTQNQWACLMRTQDLADAASWRFWDGEAFEGEFIDPYRNSSANPDEHTCTALDPDGETIGSALTDSITFNTYLDRYVLVGLSADWFNGVETWGIYYAFSDDLVHWKRRKLLAEVTLSGQAARNTDVVYAYPALLDPGSDSLSFETTGKTAYLYYTRANRGPGSPDRDLVRVPVEFFP